MGLNDYFYNPSVSAEEQLSSLPMLIEIKL